jgi:hypothetical protein
MERQQIVRKELMEAAKQSSSPFKLIGLIMSQSIPDIQPAI